jgi:hypothetical protein
MSDMNLLHKYAMRGCGAAREKSEPLLQSDLLENASVRQAF